MQNREESKIKVLSFFTGGGFMDIGFEQAGFETIWANEINSLYAEMYSIGINSMRKHNGDQRQAAISDNRSIVDISAQEIITSAFGKQSPKTFGIIGGPPCQDFSTAGSIRGFEGDRGILTKVFLERINEIEPSFFVMENVEGLWKIKKNRRQFTSMLNGITNKYIITQNILNALEYGIPQDRKRLFLVGFSKIQFPKMEFELDRLFKWPEKPYKDALIKYDWPKRSSFLHSPKSPPGVPPELCVESCLVKQHNVKVANANEIFRSYSDKFKLIDEGDTRSQSFKRLHRYRYSPTACYGNNEVHLHPYLPRRLSVREALRIQGVPDSYELPLFIGQKRRYVGLTAKFKMIGNGVPVPLAKYVASSVKQFLEDYISDSH